jgi:hypothetical protein
MEDELDYSRSTRVGMPKLPCICYFSVVHGLAWHEEQVCSTQACQKAVNSEKTPQICVEPADDTNEFINPHIFSGKGGQCCRTESRCGLGYKFSND